MQKNDIIRVILFTSKKEKFNINKIIYEIKAECPGVSISHYSVEGAPEKAKKYGVKVTPSLIIDAPKKEGCSWCTFTIEINSPSEKVISSKSPKNVHILNRDKINKKEEQILSIESTLVERICFLVKLQKLEMDIDKLTRKLKISYIHTLIIITIWILGILWLVWLSRI
jgi:hypothetical protein